jgi:ATP-dependent DNA helicase RecQ
VLDLTFLLLGGQGGDKAMHHDAMNSPLATLERVFGYHAFRSGQEEIVEAVLKGRDVFAVMPTGSGKSLCYQLPALMMEGLTLVVSPLLALMRDQVEQLLRLGAAAATLNSMTSPADDAATWRAIEDGSLRLLFVSPERLAADRFADRLAEQRIARLAVDEAHCISQWGHDFRPEYRLLPKLRDRLGKVPVTALTATADPSTQADIAKILFATPPETFIHGFDRPNLSLAFEPKDQPKRQILSFISRHRGQSGIIYCNGRQRAERMAEALSGQGIDALAYHAGMDQALRNRNQDRFLREDGMVMAATIAFGMGVNKPDVRFVVHADMPGSVESYYQEIGRAGRDGLPAATLTLYGSEDYALARRRIIEKDLSPEQRQIELKRLQSMIDLCESALCRRRAVLTYFGETETVCQGCDLCGKEITVSDETEAAKKFMSAIWRTRQMFGAHYIADLLTATANDAIARNGHKALPTHGVGKNLPKAWWLAFARKLLGGGYIEETGGERSGFRLTETGEAVLRGKSAEPVMMRQDIRDQALRAGLSRPRDLRRSEDQAAFDPADQALFDALRKLRRRLADEERVAAFIIFADRSLLDMVRLKPATREDFALVDGVGQKKLELYADAFLEAIRESGLAA